MSTIAVFSKDTAMEIGIKKCGVIIMNRGKVKSTDWLELPNCEKMTYKMMDKNTRGY